MISDCFNNTFCWLNCCLSFHLGPSQQDPARTSGITAAAVPQNGEPGHWSTKERPAKSKLDVSGSDKRPKRLIVASGKKPPKMPNRQLPQAKRAEKVCLDSDNVMFDSANGSVWWH